MRFLDVLQKKKGKRYILLYFLYCLNFLGIEFIIFLLQPYYGDLTVILSFNIILIIVIIVLIPLVHGLILFISNLEKFIKNEDIKPHKVNVILPIMLILFFNTIVVLLAYFLDEYARLISQIIEYYSFLILLVTTIGLIILLYPLFRVWPHLKSLLKDGRIRANNKGKIILGIIISAYILAFISPFLFLPANVLFYPLPPKPDIIAHRGASHLAPENTIMAGQLAVESGAVGWEVDIDISYDGVPFLMHDNDLKRTTNVEQIIPDKKDLPAENFTWTELRSLDAGSWYVESDAWGHIASGVINSTRAESYKSIKIPSFEEVLNFTRENSLILDFDTRRPQKGHPYYDDYYEILFNMTIKLIPDLSKIMIPSNSSTWHDMIAAENASAIWTYRKYDNTGDGYSNAEYRAFYERGFPIMVYTIDSMERFYELWCLGVRWVKTNDPQKFLTLTNPTIFLSIEQYTVIWIIIYVSTASTIIIVHASIKKRKTSKED